MNLRKTYEPYRRHTLFVSARARGILSQKMVLNAEQRILLCDVQKLNVFFKLADQDIPVYMRQVGADQKVSAVDILWTPPRTETLQLAKEVLAVIPTTTPIPGQHVTNMRTVAITISILFICLLQIQLQLCQPFSLPEEVHKRFSPVGLFN